ncbi:hypothetical protein Q4I28_006976 [Leishmania naiffi]|uniref:WW domain-containing protein n=1 Tax=Leishmania naiffi TaxID=5678 RepID=A0AAW3BBK8_9TRYP
MSHRYEDAVLKGMALLLLNLPPVLRSAAQPLQKLFDTHYPDNGITRILLNTPPIRSTSGEDVMECGAVFFSSSNALWAVLDRVRVLLRTEDGALELRRGYLTLGVHELLVEGVVTWGAEGRQRTASAPRTATPVLAPTVAPHAEAPQNSAVSQNAPTVAPTPISVPVATLVTASGSMPSSRKTEARSGVESCDEACQTVVVTFLLKEIYNRHRDNGEGGTYVGQGGAPSSFPPSPFMVYQMLAGECQPRKIILVECRRAAAKREWRALVELENAEVAAQVIRVFTRRAVEFVSESNAYKAPKRSRKLPEEGPLPICAEVRYYVNCNYSVRNGQTRYLPNGDRNYHRTVAVRPFCSTELDLTDPQNLARLQVKAPRNWKADPHAIRPASICDRDSPSRAVVLEEEVRPNEGESTAVQHKRRRSPSPRVSQWRSKRSLSYSRSRSTSPSSFRSYSRASSSSLRRHHRHHRHHERRGERRHRDEHRHDARAAALRDHNNPEAAAPVVSTTPETVTCAEAQSIAARRYAHTVEVCMSASETPAPVAVTYDSHGALPVGWRPIFSQEYQQTYYAYRDPNTGVETTTWERPAA